MRNSIVEGEPGIFPDPIARFFVAISRWIRRRTGKGPAAPTPTPPDPTPLDFAALDPTPPPPKSPESPADPPPEAPA